VEVARHKTAIRRRDMSMPVKCGLNDGFIEDSNCVFDYGCGHGEDLRFLEQRGIQASGWDPVFRPSGTTSSADVVNLGYVINVIEDPVERMETLKRAWNLAEKVLIVSAQILVPGRGSKHIEFGDGILTSRGTFQKFFTQAELREYVETVLETDALPAAIGVFYVFRDEELKQQFVANKYRRRSSEPRKRLSEIRFDQHRELLEPLMRVIKELGRIPSVEEFAQSEDVLREFGSMNRAFALIKRVTGTEDWDEIARQRVDDLLIYLALARFQKRPKFSRLPMGLQRDIRTFFGTYTKACEQADDLLFQAGNPDAIDEACRRSPIGKLLPNSLYVHRSALDNLEPLLRVYEGCGRTYLGELEGTNIIKIHRVSGKLSYLAYPDFETNAHPALLRSIKLNMRTQYLDCYDYEGLPNPPVLHRKETFITDSHPLYDRFTRLTRQEEKHGLLENSRYIGTRNGWENRLTETGFEVRGHRLCRRKTE
jgi:DNA phosphorothioation-associated putative methyltransferase